MAALVFTPAVTTLLAALPALQLALHALTFSGDPEIHLVFAKHLLAGYPLQFNPGIFSSGETSPLYMIAIAAVMAGFGQAAATLFMKLLGVGAALGLLYVLWEQLRRASADARASACLVLSFAALPFFFLQAQLGMENMPFALALALWLNAMLRAPLTTRRFSALSALAHVAFYLRPEAALAVLCLCGVALVDGRGAWPRLPISLALSLALGLSVLALERWTNAPLQGAGAMRVVTSRLQSLHIPGTPIYLSKSPLAFVAYAWPLLLSIARQRRGMPRPLRVVLACLVLLPLTLHLLDVFPNTHFSRYSLYCWYPLWGVFSLALPRGAAWRPVAALFVVNALLCGAGELALRVRNHQFANRELLAALAAAQPGAAQAVSDALCRRIDCSHTPVVVALQEVQLRLLLDARFVVRSLDGVVDSDLLRYVSADGGLDELGYLAHERVDLVLSFPDYAGTKRADSLSSIFARSAAGPVVTTCAVFERVWLPGFVYGVGLQRTPLAACR
jgi:hypothetical protein